MMRKVLLGAALVWLSGRAWCVDFPIGGGGRGVVGLRLAAVGGVEAKLDFVRRGQTTAARVTFAKATPGRRLLALEARVTRKLAGIKTAKLIYRLDMAEGQAPRPVVAVFEEEGAMWFRRMSQPLVQGREATVVVPMGSMRLASFSRDETGKLEWGRVVKAWVGMVIDGPARGTLELTGAWFSTDPFKAAEPLKIEVAKVNQWNVGHDPRVKYATSTPAEGPQGQKCFRIEFTFPVGRHMYLTPTLRLPEAEMEGYSSVRFSYKAMLPKGITGLLVTVAERDGSQYEAYPYPPASAQWRTVTIPFSRFRPASWTRDENERLDLGQIRSITIGAHGTARGDGGKGTIWIGDLWLVP